MDRRDFLKILGITSSTTLISSCGVDKANEKIIPHVIPPEMDVYPGKPVYFSTSCTECPALCGLEVKVNEKVYQGFRGLFPTKLEGIKNHPVNNGALCSRGQAGLFRLYHPHRIKRPLLKDQNGNLRVVTWREALDRLKSELSKSTDNDQSNVFLSGRTTGTISEIIDRFCREYQIERLPEYEPFSHANIREANRIVFNRREIPAYRIDKADYLLTFGADIFETFVSPVSLADRFAKARRQNNLNWIHLEPHLSLTGVNADKRIVINPQNEAVVLGFLIHSLLQSSANKKNLPSDILSKIPRYSINEVSQHSGIKSRDLRMLVERLVSAKNPLIITGGVSTAHERGLEAAVLTAILQWILGANENVVDFSVVEEYSHVGDMRDMQKLVGWLENNRIGVMIVSKTDPISSLPASFDFPEQFGKAAFRVGMADMLTENIRECDLILPLSHSLESWGDTVPRKGLRTVIQPVIEPQFDTLSEGDIFLRLLKDKSIFTKFDSYEDYLHDRWLAGYGQAKTDQFLNQGFIEENLSSIRVELNNISAVESLAKFNLYAVETGVSLLFVPSIRSYDGRSRDLHLISELPDPLTTITYDNWLSVSPAAARLMELNARDEVNISAGDFSQSLPVKVQELLPEKVVMIQRDLVKLPGLPIDERSGETYWYLRNINIKKTGIKIAVPILAGSMQEDDRGLLPAEDSHEKHAHEHDHEEGRMYPPHEHKDYRWGMAIDLDNCIGCNACSAACYVENNIPVVGKEEHLKGREMSWIRLEPFVDADKNEVEFVPMLCQHCDNAPCEPVCPVYAAYHNEEGLNVQVYNRCVGTRYCSNNCPYKVRRFNWFDHRLPQPLDKMYNPDVSIRDRGIMEKCTFCIQRIRSAKDLAKDENRLVNDGEVVPACAQTCPTRAITFGNLMDENSKVYKLAHSQKAYRALEELGTEPAVYYLRKKTSKQEA